MADERSNARAKAIELHLHIRVPLERREELIAFLKEAVPYYETLDGVLVRLVENREDPTDLIEIIQYRDVQVFDADQARVAGDARMQAYIACWRTIIAGPPVVRVYAEVDLPMSRIPR